jgi:cytochrome c
MKRNVARIILALASTLAVAPAFADLALASSRNCMSCHNLDRKIVGPSLKDIAAKYKGDKTAPGRLASKIMEGGGGAWGVVKMPANPQVSETEAKKLATWVLSL